MSTRADEIHKILSATNDGRMRVSEVLTQLKKVESDHSLISSSVSVAVRYDNDRRKNQGQSPRFKHSGDKSEVHGYVSLMTLDSLQSSRKKILEKPEEQLPLLIEAANKAAKEKLKEDMAKLDWKDFESGFLTTVLESLGFTQIEITQRTKDGGKDALCEYQRGIVRSKVIVSAKHWAKSGAVVPVDEVQRVRGISSDADTAIIITSSSFSEDAKKEAAPRSGMRTVVLIDGDLIVEGCFKSGIGVEEVANIPKLVRFVGITKFEE